MRQPQVIFFILLRCIILILTRQSRRALIVSMSLRGCNRLARKSLVLHRDRNIRFLFIGQHKILQIYHNLGLAEISISLREEWLSKASIQAIQLAWRATSFIVLHPYLCKWEFRFTTLTFSKLHAVIYLFRLQCYFSSGILKPALQINGMVSHKTSVYFFHYSISNKYLKIN